MLTINHFQDIIELDVNSINYDYDLVGTVLSVPADEMDELPIDTFVAELTKIKRQILIRKIKETEVWNNIEVGKKNDFMNLTFGDYVSLESFLNDKKFNDFLKIIYKTEIDFYDAPLSILFYKIDEFQEFVKLIQESYESLFSPVIDDNDEDEEILISPKRRVINTKEQQMAAKQKKWSWYSIAFSLAKNDITKLDAVFEQPLIKTLNILTMVRDLQIDLNPNAYPLY